jgi:proline iminopeptidase
MRTFKHLNKDLYVHMQGHIEFGMTPNATLGNWNRSGDLGKIEVPTLTVGATHYTMDPKHMQ